MMFVPKYNLTLGSGSPRRSELLTKAGFEFVIRAIDVDESYPEDLAISDIAEYIAINKSNAHNEILAEGELVITADTIVVFENEVYGKPVDKEEAIETILKLSDKVHDVYSGVSFLSKAKKLSFTEMSQVKFGLVMPEEAERYVEEAAPLDKAGSYGIQDWIGFARIEWIKGSYTNILGLPLAQTYDAIKHF